MEKNNIGEGIAFAGIILSAVISGEYLLLLLVFIPIISWSNFDYKINNQRNDEKHNLDMKKLREEIRLLKIRKRVC